MTEYSLWWLTESFIFFKQLFENNQKHFLNLLFKKKESKPVFSQQFFFSTWTWKNSYWVPNFSIYIHIYEAKQWRFQYRQSEKPQLRTSSQNSMCWHPPKDLTKLVNLIYLQNLYLVHLRQGPGVCILITQGDSHVGDKEVTPWISWTLAQSLQNSFFCS